MIKRVCITVVCITFCRSEEVVKCLTDDLTYRPELVTSELWTEPGNH